MPADTAKYLLTIADLDPKNVEITVFWGIGAIGGKFDLSKMVEVVIEDLNQL